MKIARYYQKTLFGMFAMMGIIVVAISALYVNTVDRELSGNFIADAKAIARGIADSNVDVVVNENYSALQSIINQFTEISGISYVFVVDDAGNIIAHTFVPAVPEEIVADFVSGKPSYDRQVDGMGSFIEVTADMLSGEVGRVHVGMDNGFIALQVQTGDRQAGLSAVHPLRAERTCVLRADVSGLAAVERPGRHDAPRGVS